MFFAKRAHLTNNITSYDLLKCLALVLMTIDHLGFYFFPDNVWFRIAGRGCLPIWFGLIGYANTRELPRAFWVGGFILVAANIIFGFYLAPLNIFFTMLALRATIDFLARIYFKDTESMIFGMLLFVIIGFPSNYVTEYGTLAIPMALFGYALRHKNDLKISRVQLGAFLVLCPVIFGLLNGMMFSIDLTPIMAATAIVCATSLMMVFFKPVEFPRLTRVVTAPLSWVVRMGGRYTMEYYILHLLAFKMLAFMLDGDKYKLFTPTLLPNAH